MASKTAAERKRAQKDRERQELEKKGGRRISMLVYGNTLAAIEDLAKHYGFTGKQRIAETVTHLIHEKHDNVTTHENEGNEK